MTTPNCSKIRSALLERLKNRVGSPKKFKDTEFAPLFKALGHLRSTAMLLAKFPKKKDGRGRPPYNSFEMLKLFLFQVFKGIGQNSDLCWFLQHSKLRWLIFKDGKIPSESSVSRYFNRFDNNILDLMIRELARNYFQQNPAVAEDIVGDGTDFATAANKWNHKDPDAAWQVKGKYSRIWGYRSVNLLSTRTTIVLGVCVRGKNADEACMVAEMQDQGKYVRPPKARYFIYDSKVDSEDMYTRISHDAKCIPVIGYNPRNSRIRRYEDLPADNIRKKLCCISDDERRQVYKRLRPRSEGPYGIFKKIMSGYRSNVVGEKKNTTWYLLRVLAYNLIMTSENIGETRKKDLLYYMAGHGGKKRP